MSSTDTVSQSKSKTLDFTSEKQHSMPSIRGIKISRTSKKLNKALVRKRDSLNNYKHLRTERGKVSYSIF